jgi:hypothetical protein
MSGHDPKHHNQAMGQSEFAVPGPDLFEGLPPWPGAHEPLPALDPKLFEGLQGTIAQEEQSRLKRLRSLGTHAKFAVIVCLPLVLTVLLMVLKPRLDLKTYPMYRMLGTLASFGTLFGIGVWLSLRPTYRPPLPSWLQYSWLALFALLPIGMSLLPAATAHHPHPTMGTGAMFWPAVFGCNIKGLILSSPFFWLLGRLLLDEQAPIMTKATIALAMGLLGNLILQIICPAVDPLHLLLSHATVGLLFFFGSVSMLIVKRARSK